MTASLSTSSEEKYAALNAKHEELLAQLESVQKEHADAIGVLQTEVSMQKEANAVLEASLAAAPKTLDIEALEHALKDIQSSSAEEIGKLTKERDDMAKGFEIEKQRFAKELQDTKDRTDREVKSLENVYNLQIEDLKRTVSSQREKIADLEKRFSEGDATSSGLVEELNKERATKEAINKQLDAMSEEVWSAKSAKDSMSKELDALSQSLVAVKISNEKEIAEVIAVKEFLQKQIETLSEEIVAIKSERDNAARAAAKEVEVLSGEIAALKESKEATTNKLIVLSEELATAKADKGAALETAKTELKAALEAHSSSAEASLKDFEAKLEDASKEKEATISTALAKAEAETSEIEKARQGLQKKLNEKDVIIEKFTKEHEEYESEIPSLKEKLALAEALVREKEAAVENLKKEQEANLKVLRAELAEARLGKGAETGDAEVSTSTGDMGAHCYPSGYDAEDKGVVAIVRHPIFWTWMFYFPCSLIYFGCCLEPGTKFCFTADV